MQHHFQNLFGDYVPEHISPGIKVPRSTNPDSLRADIDAANLTEMWNMILTLDYSVSDVSELPPGQRDEFLNVMSLLLSAFNR
ncbi:hypothetical protein [Roseibium sp.]|uniref:hypothetical protein n=1 Tax=Roseibium sp. TaxID=1936156 RepID=UPI003B51D440